MNENNIKALFPEDVETITISKNDYDRLYGQLTYENIILQSKIDKAIECLENLKAEFELYNYITDFDNKMNKPINILKENK